MKTKTWYNMEPKGETEAEISIYDTIGSYEINAKQFDEDLKSIKADTIHLRINSYGGDVIDGNAIFNSLQRHSAKVITHIDGIAASMASVVAMAGEEVRMADNALLMIHNPWTVTIGNAEELRKDADLLDKVRGTILGAYSRSQYSDEEIIDLMDADTWMTAQEALDAGFVDEIETGLRAAAQSYSAQSIGGIEVPAEKQIAAMSKQIDALSKSATEISAKLDAKDAELTTVSAELADARAEVESAELAKAGAEALAKKIEGELETKAAEVKAKEVEIEQAKIVTDAAVSAKAAELMQSSTVPPVADDDADANAKSNEALLEEYSKLTNHVDRRKFRAKHKEQLSKLF
jgi:ATP-dependent protease ClpP protease subunit